MPKEFDLNRYQYTETVLTPHEWILSYRPQMNMYDSDARFGGWLYEHEGRQWQHVASQQNHYQWTLFRDEDGELKIKNGLVVRGRIGYFLCETQHNAHETFIVSGLAESLLAKPSEGDKN